MRVLFLLVNSVCDIACTYCFYTTGYEKRSFDRIDPEKAGCIAEKISSAGFGTVILSGGDPFCSRFKHETFILIHELKKVGLKVIVNTSAVGLNEDDLKNIISLDVDRIDISIDSHDSLIHDAQRGKHASTHWAITNLIEKGYHKVSSTTVVTEQNASSLLKTIFWLRSLGIEDTRIQRVFLLGSEEGSSKIMASMYEVAQYLGSVHILKYLSLTEQTFNGRQFILDDAQCKMGKQYFVCNALGFLMPCFHREDIKLGNLFEDPIDEIMAALKAYGHTMCNVPACFGKHCVSLFDNPTFWR